jgi:hypothetical protein
MTREHRLVLSLDEITALRWQCPRCRAAISYTLTETIRLPDQCPACYEDFGDEAHKDATTAARAFVQALKGRATRGLVPPLEILDPPDA